MPNVSRLTNYKWVEPLCSQPELYTRNDHIYENPWLWRHTCIKCESERLKSFQLQTQTRACGAGAGDTTGNKGLNSMWIQQLSKINNTVKVDLAGKCERQKSHDWWRAMMMVSHTHPFVHPVVMWEEEEDFALLSSSVTQTQPPQPARPAVLLNFGLVDTQFVLQLR